jgi:hypothetical protein
LQHLLVHQFAPPRAKLVVFLDRARVTATVGDALIPLTAKDLIEQAAKIQFCVAFLSTP